MKSQNTLISFAPAFALSALQVTVLVAAPGNGADISAEDFTTNIDNPFFPLEPGTTFIYDGFKDRSTLRDEFAVTHATAMIDGVVCRVIHDIVFVDGILEEDTLDYFAQDEDGNVWYFGEDTKELDANGNVVSTEGSWRAGVNGAQQGIIMEANPRVGDSYNQENAPGVAQDMARVSSLKKSACVPYGCFDDFLLTRESVLWSRVEFAAPLGLT